MQKQHPLVEKWLQDHRRARYRSSQDPVEFRFGPNRLDYRKYRLLSQIFFAAEERHITPNPLAWRAFYFSNETIKVRAYLQEIPNSTMPRVDMAKLEFIVVEHRICVYSKWTDEQAPLEEQINDIADGVERFLSQIRTWTKMANERALDEQINTLQKQLNDLIAKRDSQT